MKMICLDEKIGRRLKLRKFKKVFQITKQVKFDIQSKKKEIEILQVMELLIARDKKKSQVQKVESGRAEGQAYPGRVKSQDDLDMTEGRAEPTQASQERKLRRVGLS